MEPGSQYPEYTVHASESRQGAASCTGMEVHSWQDTAAVQSSRHQPGKWKEMLKHILVGGASALPGLHANLHILALGRAAY